MTDTTISLGIMGDTSGVFKNLGAAINAGNQLWADDVNGKGGICNRQLKLEVVDHGYKADTAKTLYPQLEPKVLGIVQLLGSPVLAALKQNLIDDNMTAAPASWSSQILNNPNVMMIGTTYDLEIVNGLAYLQQQGLIKDGDTVGHIYIDGEYGGNGLLGSKYYAGVHKLNVKEAKITSTDNDLTNIVTGFKGDGVKAIVLTTTPGQSASALAANQALALNVPVLGNNPTFDPALLSTPAAGALGNLYVAASSAPFSSETPKAAEIAAAYKSKYAGLAAQRRRRRRVRRGAGLAGRADEGVREQGPEPRGRADGAEVADLGEDRRPRRRARLQLARLAAHPRRVHRQGRREGRGRPHRGRAAVHRP